jgi:hypothetical protein
MARRSAHNILNDSFTPMLEKAFKEKFSLEVETAFNIIGMRKITKRLDGEPFTPAQHEWIGAFEAGYLAAMKSLPAEGRK